LFRDHIKVISIIALHSMLNISKSVKYRGLVPKDRKWHMGYQMVTWTMTSRDPEGAVRQYGRLS